MSVYIGIDIGGTKIAAGLVTDTGEVLGHSRCPTPLSGGTSILEAALRLAAAYQSEPRLAAVGVGTGGQVNADLGTIVSATDLLPGWAGTAVKAAFEAAFPCPCAVDNDVNALAVGEARFGAGQHLATVAYLALGTGVGGALLLDGRLHHGAHWTGGEFGHLLLTMDPGATRRTLEDYVSGPGLVQTYREMSGFAGQVSGEAIAAEAEHNPESAAALAVTRTGEYLGYGLVSLASILDPDLFVVGGGLASLGDLLLAPARRALARHALPGPARCPVAVAALGPHASLVGAASLAMPG